MQVLSHAIDERFFDGRVLINRTKKKKMLNYGRIIYFGEEEMSPCYPNIHFILYYVRRTTTCHKPTHTHTRTHARRLTHTRNQLCYCRIHIYEDIIYICNVHII